MNGQSRSDRIRDAYPSEADMLAAIDNDHAQHLAESAKLEAASKLRTEICSLENHGDIPSDSAELLLELVAILSPQPV